MLSPSELQAIVAADLKFLRDEWDNDVEDHSLRRSSTVLRRLLVDGELQRAWKQAGFEREPRIATAVIDPILQHLDLRRTELVTAGGAHCGSAVAQGCLKVNYSMSDDEIRALNQLGPSTETLGLRRFVQSPCMVIRSEPISRRILVKFVANRLGGAHGRTSPGKKREEQLYAHLDWSRHEFQIFGKPVVYFELLSVGQALLNAPDVHQLLERLAAV
jgi:hypothetical protein